MCLLVGGITLYRSTKEVEVVETDKAEKSVPIKATATPVPKKKVEATETETSEDKAALIDIDKFDAEMDKIEESWQKQMLEVFINDLKLSEEEFKEYLVMREGFEDDRYDAYQKYHEENLKKKDSYPITNENEANDKLVEEYQSLFENRFGKEAFARYVKKLDEFNSDLRVKRGQDEGILTIDF